MKLPPPLNWLWAGWMKLSLAIGFVMSRILLTVLWIVGFGVYAIVQKIGNLFQSKKPTDTYWIDSTTQAAGSLKNQF